MFKVGAPVDGQDFIGREEEIHRIISAMKSGNNISIYGMARIGKSSIVKEVIRRAKKENIFEKTPFFFQYRLTQDKNTRYHFFEDLKDFIADLADKYKGEEDGIRSINKLLTRIENSLNEKEVNSERYIRLCEKITELYDNDIWLVLDEMDYANTAFGSYIQKIREIVNTDRVHVINISRHSLASIFPAYGNGSNYPGVITQNFPIIGFSEADIAAFREHFINKLKMENATGLWEETLEYAGNVPYFMALLGNGILEAPTAAISDIAKNPYGKYMETLKYWYDSLYSDNMLENTLKYIESEGKTEATNLRVFGIVRNGSFTVPQFAVYVQERAAIEQADGLIDDYTKLLPKIDGLSNQGQALLQGILRDDKALKLTDGYLKELSAMKLKIECMKALQEKNTFVKLEPSIEEHNMFVMRLREINGVFEGLME